MLVTILVVLIASCIDAHKGYKQIHKLKINERGTQFEESVEVNPKERTVLYKVPAHNDVAESEVLFDYKTGYMATKIAKLGECYIQLMPEDISSPEDIGGNLRMYEMLNGSEPTPVKTIASAAIKERSISKTELRLLSPRFSAFCGDYKVYKVKKIHQKKGSWIQKNQDIGKNSRRRFVRDNPKVSWAKFPIYVDAPATSPKIVTVNSCKDFRQYIPVLKKGGCLKDTDSWVFHCAAKTRNCIYTLQCKKAPKKSSGSNNEAVALCHEEHFFTGWLCCDVACPLAP